MQEISYVCHFTVRWSSRVYVMNIWGRRGMAPHMLNHGTRRRWVVNFKPRQLSPRGKSPRYPLTRGWDRPHSRSDFCSKEKIYDTRVVQPAAQTLHRLLLFGENHEYLQAIMTAFNGHGTVKLNDLHCYKRLLCLLDILPFMTTLTQSHSAFGRTCTHHFVTQRFIDSAVIVKPNNRNSFKFVWT
jgi:hypothetical protein